MGRFEPIPAQNKTWVAGLFLEPLASMLTSEPSIHMDLLVICQLKPSQNGQIVMCQVWPFWLLICLGKWNNKSMTTGYVMKFDHGWQFNHGWLLELTNFTVGDSCGGACYDQELYNLLCPQNMWMVSPTFFFFFLIGEISPKNEVKNRNSKTQWFLKVFNRQKWKKKDVKSPDFYTWFSICSQNIKVWFKEFFSSYLVYRLNLPCNEHDVPIFFYIFLWII
jgi:hypothetical protein